MGHRKFTNASRRALKLRPFWRKVIFAANFINGIGILASVSFAGAWETATPVGNGCSQ
jgi:hypothetical protein